MIKLIPIEKLQPGMYVHDLNCSWMEHNFVRSRFAVKDEAVVRKVRAIGTHEIYIDTARGLDLPEAPTREEIEHEVDEKIDAIAAEAAPRIAAQEVACEIERARALHREANLIVRDMMADVRLGKQIEMELIEPLVERIVDSIFTQQDALIPLARLKQHDAYTFQHSVSVCALMTTFARNLQLPRPVIHEIAVGALLHDVGKASVPDAILNKPAKLTDAEFAKMKNHVVQSKIILQATPGISAIALDVAAQHHERFDGTGTRTSSRGTRSAFMARWAPSWMSTTPLRPTASITRACRRPRRSASCWTGASSTSSPNSCTPSSARSGSIRPVRWCGSKASALRSCRRRTPTN